MSTSLSRRSFIAMCAILPWSLRAFAATSMPVGLNSTLRNALKDDPMGTVRTVGQMGYRSSSFMRLISIGLNLRQRT